MAKNVRRSQLIAPYGVGSIVNFPMEESLMTAGLDVWRFGTNPEEFVIKEERLQQRLNVKEFRMPPDFRTPGPGVNNPNVKVPFVRFPRWHYCRRCGDMRELGVFSELPRCAGPNFSEGQSCHKIIEKKRCRLQPMRFIAVCRKYAHIQDFPWMEWVHCGDPISQACRLRYRTSGGTASIAGISIRCTCGKNRSLAFAFAEDALRSNGIDVQCSGLRPWLGQVEGAPSDCGESLDVVQRGASNVYFDHVASSIYLPLWAESTSRSIVAALEDGNSWTVLKSGLVDGKISLDRCTIVCQMRGMPAADAHPLQQAAQRKLDASSDQAVNSRSFVNPYEEEERYRQAEYDALRTGRGGRDVDLYCKLASASTYGGPISQFFSKIGLVYKLRETRALYGFSRYQPDDERTVEEHISALRLNPDLDWLPAVETRGEGIFFELDEQQVNAWSSQPAVIARIQWMNDKFNNPIGRRPIHTRNVTPKFVLLHTLAHLLINRLSYECGYGSSSLRERIYCNTEFMDHSMSGFLIYTAAGDSDGTMGGLVRQGEVGRLEGVLKRALKQAAWCSYDPICGESTGQGPDSCNLAACHGCAILPETSCEEGNRLLDRVTVAGLPGKSGLGLFGAYIQGIFAS